MGSSLGGAVVIKSMVLLTPVPSSSGLLPQKVLVVFFLLLEERWHILSDLNATIVRTPSLQTGENLTQVCLNNRYLLALRSPETEAARDWFGEATEDPILSVL